MTVEVFALWVVVIVTILVIIGPYLLAVLFIAGMILLLLYGLLLQIICWIVGGHKIPDDYEPAY